MTINKVEIESECDVTCGRRTFLTVHFRVNINTNVCRYGLRFHCSCNFYGWSSIIWVWTDGRICTLYIFCQIKWEGEGFTMSVSYKNQLVIQFPGISWKSKYGRIAWFPTSYKVREMDTQKTKLGIDFKLKFWLEIFLEALISENIGKWHKHLEMEFHKNCHGLQWNRKLVLIFMT